MLRPTIHLMALCFGALVGAFVVGPPTVRAQVTDIPIAASAIPLNRGDPAARDIGALRYLGGLHITSPDRRFGGISGLHWDPDCQRLLAVTDTGAWVIFTPIHADGRLTGLALQAQLAAIRDLAGNAPARKALADAEALSHDASGATLVWFERQNHAQRYVSVSACRPDSLNQPAAAIIAPPGMAGWPVNDGPEAAARFHAHQLVFSEHRNDGTGEFAGLILAASGATVARVPLTLPRGYKPTGLAQLDEAANGETARYLLLARQFSPARGVSARLMLITVSMRTGIVASVELAHLAPPLSVDNMEAVAIRRDADRVIIYLMSDDNFNALQKTILLAFQWQPPPAD